MELAIRYLRATDTKQAAEIDASWYGERAISKPALDEFIRITPDRAIAVVCDDTVYGFATFEVVEQGNLPASYVAQGVPLNGRMLFIQQFTTTQNYSGDMTIDSMLLDAIEVMAKKINCVFIGEALDVNHAYKKEKNPSHDVFGFYESRGFTPDIQHEWEWREEGNTEVPCVLFYKNVETHL